MGLGHQTQTSLWFGICLEEVGDAGDQVAHFLPPDVCLLPAWGGRAMILTPTDPSGVLVSEVLGRRCISRQEFPREGTSERRREERRRGGRGWRGRMRERRNFYRISPMCQVPY